MVKYFIQKNSGNFEEAQDVFQDAIIVLYEQTKKPQFQLNCSLKTYFYSIVRNLWLKTLSKRKIKISIADYEKYYSVSVESVLSENENKYYEIEKALSLLGEKCRKLLVSFYFERKKMQLIAEEMGYKKAVNAKSQKYKCMQQLKKLVK